LPEIHEETLESSYHICSSCYFGSCRRGLRLLMVRVRCLVNRSCTVSSKSLVNGKYRDFHFAYDFLGSTFHRNPRNHRSSSRLAMVEKTTQRRKRIPFLWQTLTHNKRRKRRIAFVLYCLLHQGLHRRKLECACCILDFGLCGRFNDYDTNMDCNHLWNPCGNRNHLVDTPRD
jgi:hypothetical protein